jgi:hypothetical protein
MTWTAPLSSLLTLHGDEVTHDLLAGRQVVSELVMAVVPNRCNDSSLEADDRAGDAQPAAIGFGEGPHSQSLAEIGLHPVGELITYFPQKPLSKNAPPR